MLELPEIKSGDFEETLDRLKKQIPSLCPEWYSTGESSPGIMLLELLTYISLQQRDSMNKIGGKALFNLGKLLGYTPEKLSPAYALAELSRALPKGGKLRIDNMVFETLRDFSPSGKQIAMLGRCNEQGGLIPLNHGVEAIRLFSETDSFVMGFDKPVEDGVEMRLALCFNNQGRKIPENIDRASWGDIVRWQYYSKDGWKDVELISDSTLSCFRTGELVFHLKGHSALDGVYPIRCIADPLRFDLLPLLKGVYTDSCPVRQTDTKCDCVYFDINSFESNRMVFSNALAESGVFRLFVNTELGWCNAEDMNIAFDVVKEQEHFRLATSSRKELAQLFSALDGSEVLMLVMYEQAFLRDFTCFSSDGSANQNIPLNFDSVFAEELQLMTAREQDGVFFWSRWRNSDKLSVEAPESHCFAVDSQRGNIIFGDGLHGAVPPACGRKNIMLTALRLTRGAGGNISPCTAEYGESKAEIVSPAQGGKNDDTPDSFFARVISAPKSGTLLTFSDYEKAALETEGVILKSAQAYCTKDRSGKIKPNEITVLIEPQTSRSDKNFEGLEWIIDAVKHHLNELRTINTGITVLFPKYIPVSVALSFEGTGFSSDSEREAEECIREYFRENCGGTIDVARLTKQLSMLTSVSSVHSLEFSEPAINGKFTAPEGSRIYLGSCNIYCVNRR
ncbi:MAG: hypothetical protein ACI4J1_03035 [Ruminiclostridium sp.]